MNGASTLANTDPFKFQTLQNPMRIIIGTMWMLGLGFFIIKTLPEIILGLFALTQRFLNLRAVVFQPGSFHYGIKLALNLTVYQISSVPLFFPKWMFTQKPVIIKIYQSVRKLCIFIQNTVFPRFGNGISVYLNVYRHSIVQFFPVLSGIDGGISVILNHWFKPFVNPLANIKTMPLKRKWLNQLLFP